GRASRGLSGAHAVLRRRRDPSRLARQGARGRLGMTQHGAHAKHAGWVGRSIRRLEDPALVTGQGCFASDLAAAKWVRFVRSPVAPGRIARLPAPDGVDLIPGADGATRRPIPPMLSKFNYVPVAQPILAAEVVRFAGEPVAAVIADSREAAEDGADL